MRFKVYEYPLKDNEGNYVGSYTIKENVSPLGFEGEKLVEEYDYERGEKIDWEKDMEW